MLICIVIFVRIHFRRLNCSQEPQLMQLQQNLYEQLTDNNSMPKSATKSAASQIRELIKIPAECVLLKVSHDVDNVFDEDNLLILEFDDDSPD